jgi:hypothetical protein
MIRSALSVMVALLSLSLPAFASVPVPTPKPVAKPAEDPQNAFARLMSEGNDDLGAAVAAYAPASRTSALAPRPSGQVSLYLVAKLSEDGPPVESGIVWRVFREFPGADGELPLIHKSSGGDLELRLKADRYIVHASYGRAAVSRTLDLRSAVTSETLVLNAGGLQLQAKLDEADARMPNPKQRFDVHMIEGESRRHIGTIPAGRIARLPAGAYHVVSRVGGVNAVRSADVIVEAGKLTRVSLRHSAGRVNLKLVRDRGGEALADTAWTVYDPDGEPVFERVGAHADIVLEAGEYTAVARHRDTRFRHRFQVRSGDLAEVEVLADRL